LLMENKLLPIIYFVFLNETASFSFKIIVNNLGL
jgi:hypothetical protein